MTVKQRRTKWKAGFIIAIAVIFLITLFALSFAMQRGDTASAATKYGERGTYLMVADGTAKGFVTTISGLNQTQINNAYKPADGQIRSANDLCYVIFGGATGTYTLAANFWIRDYTWAMTKSTLTCTLDGAGYEIWNDAATPEVTEDNPLPINTSDYVGGLVGENSGTIKNLYYFYSSGFYAKKVASADYLAVGGMVGRNKGVIDNCHVDIAGSIETEGKKEAVTSYVGGMIGYLESGNVKECPEIISTCSVNAYTDKDSGTTAKHSIVYAGGVVGRIDGGFFQNNTILASGAVMSADNTEKWEGTVGSIIGGAAGAIGLDVDVSTEYNDKEHIHPAGVVIGGVGKNGIVLGNEVETTGSAISYGTGGASNGGSISGGFIGELADNCTSNAKIQKNAVKVEANLSAFMVEEFSVVGTVASWFLDRNMTIYLGGVVGKCNASSITFSNNYFSINTGDGIIENGYGEKSDLGYSCETGLLCGNNALVSKLGSNNWLVRKLSESDSGRIAGNETSYGNLNHLVIFGDGEVGVSGGKITGDTISVTAKPICSPFYGWTSDIGGATLPDLVPTRSKALPASSAQLLYAVFIDTNIESSGELTQLAKDINQIDLKVYKNIGTSGTEDSDGNPLMYFAGKTAPTLKWLHVELGKDILVRDGTPVIEDFYGYFDGKGHTISFAAGSKITHDFEKEEDREGREETFDPSGERNDVASYDEYATGLFGIIHEGATVIDLSIVFGGAIDESSGIAYSVIEKSGDKLKAKRKHELDKEASDPKKENDANSVYNHVISYTNFTDAKLAFDNFNEVYFYGLTGDGYNASRTYNPGYIEIVPYQVDIIVNDSYVGILAGKNYGRIENVNVEATKSAYVTTAANNSYFGTLCGLNAGQINNISVTMNGKVLIKARNTSETGGAVAGGMIGVSQVAQENMTFNGLNAYVGGEIKAEGVYNYHSIHMRMYNNAAFNGDGKSVPDGYTLIAYDADGSNDEDDAVDAFSVKQEKGTVSYRLFGNDKTVVNEVIGTLIGRCDQKTATYKAVAAVSGAKGTFNTKIYQTDAATAKIGAMVGYLNSGVPSFSNAWAVMSYEEFPNENNELTRRKPIGSSNQTGGINLIYSQETVAIASIDLDNVSTPLSFSLASQEGKVFSGWYDWTSGEKQVIVSGLEGNVFTPLNTTNLQDQNQNALTDKIYVAEVLPLQFFSEDHMKKLSSSTAEGRVYKDVTFSLGADITLTNFTPIGTLENPFQGTLDGNGLTISLSSNQNGDYAGVFGCVGSHGTIKNVVVRIAGNIGNKNTLYTGGVAAINYGTIGQNSSTGKVVVNIEQNMTGKHVGGIVGINHRVVKNAEVYFVYKSVLSYGLLTADAGKSDQTTYAGGAIGYNQYVNEATIAKNLIVYIDNTKDNTPFLVNTSKYALGGVIGENSNGAAAYSLVSVFNYASIFPMAGSSGSDSQFRGLIIGHNSSLNNVDSLWALCLSKSTTSSVEYDPELGAPLSVYQGNNGEVTTSQAVLMNGSNHNDANILIKYGWGDVSVSINGDESIKGGQITFHATKLSRKNSEGTETVPEEKRISFYDYISSFENGDKVPVSEGNAGFAFSPTVGMSVDGNGLTGKVYYAGFCNTTIASQSDYIKVAENIENNYRLYVKYNITNNFTLDRTVTASIGSNEHPFIGSINGNAYTVTMDTYKSEDGATSLLPFVGVLGSESNDTHSSVIKNLFFEVRSGNYSLTEDEDVARGFLTDVNYGTISNVTLSIHGYLKNLGGATGTIAGQNYGKIESASVTIEYAKAFGVNGFGALFGKNVGGLVGENYGEIGTSMPNSITVMISRASDYLGTLYGSESVGAIAGVNGEGASIRSAFVTFSGRIVGKKASGLVGENLGRIESAVVTINQNAIYAGSIFGTIAGVNSGTIGEDEINYDDASYVIKAYIYSSPSVLEAYDVKLGETTIYSIPATTTAKMGGIVGKNALDGVANAMICETHASLIASSDAGGLVGENAGSIGYSSLTAFDDSDIIADISGGLVGENSGTIDRVVATLRGKIGSDHKSYAGGIFGKNTLSDAVSNTAVALYRDVYATNIGLGAGMTVDNCASNTWVQICNSSRSGVVGNATDDESSSGINVIRVLNETLLNVDLSLKKGTFVFSSVIPGVKKWYTDISNWTANRGFISKLTGKQKCETDGTELNVKYYVCYDNLEIRSYSEFNSFAAKINSHSYYYNVLFRLEGDIMVDNDRVLLPIGTEEYPFNGIFDGTFYSIEIEKGSAISGQYYTGLFGYTAPNSVIKNFIFTVEKGAAIGGVNSRVIGSLVGYNQGQIENVFVNLSIDLTYNSKATDVGELIGKQETGAPDLVNVWISVLNGKNSVIGNMTDKMQYGANYLGVLGDGMTEVSFVYPKGDNGYEDLSDYRDAYLKKEDNDEDFPVSVKYAAVAKDFQDFDNWYKDIAAGTTINSGTVNEIGTFVGNPDNEDIHLITKATENSNVTLSFIKLTIKTAADFIKFANNVNTYGDQGAIFTLEADIIVDLTDCPAVGTPDRPFTGIFDGGRHAITVVGESVEREYAGLFGYVSRTATRTGVIKNLLIDVGEKVRFGDSDTLYAGVAVALLYGEMDSVVVRVHADTIVYTTQGAPTSAGLVGRAGKVNKDATVVYPYKIDNCWLIIEENATVTETIGREEEAVFDSFYENNGVGRKMRIVGDVTVEESNKTNPFEKGMLMVTINADGSILFNAENTGTVFYGYIDNTTIDENKMTPINDGDKLLWTVRPGDVYGDDNKPTSLDMIAVFIDTNIDDVREFLMISENVRLGRNYKGIIYKLNNDIEITAEDLPNGIYSPIGGEVKISSGNGFESYIERDFVGGFMGNGHTITLSSDVVIDARYAGLFGRVAASARIRDLIVIAEGQIGKDGDNTTRTIYSGVLAGYALGGKYDNIVVSLEKTAVLFGSVSTGRAFGYLPTTLENDVATNCWAISYNSKENYLRNESEYTYNKDKGEEGSNQGGFNTLMVIGAGILNINYSDKKYYFTYSDPNSAKPVYPYWYDRNREDTPATEDDYFHTRENDVFENDFVGSWSEAFLNSGYYPVGNEKRLIYKVSFLNKDIDSYDDLLKYANNVNNGYDFYKLTFTLTKDIEIADANFVGIGTAASGMNGTFDGNKHTITLPSSGVLSGEYAGIFRYVSEDGEIANLRIVLGGTVGNVSNTKYAGAIAYNNGVLRNVIVISNKVSINSVKEIQVGKEKVSINWSGLVVGYDNRNIMENVWALVDASSYVNTIGYCAVGDSRINTMTVIGVGVVDANFENENDRVRFTSDGTVSVMGWYKSFEENQQISKAMLAGGDLTNELAGYLIAPDDYIGVSYEVAVIKTTLTTVEDIVAIAEDVRYGGYSFENITFNLGANIEIGGEDGLIAIGTSSRRFKGTFSGKDENYYYTITYNTTFTPSGTSAVSLFNYNAGEITDLTVIVEGTLGGIAANSNNIYGAVAAYNYGTIKKTYVKIVDGGIVTGNTVGGLVGENYGTVSNCIVRIEDGGSVLASTNSNKTINAGGIAGINYGTIEGATDFSFSDWNDRSEKYYDDSGNKKMDIELLPKNDNRISKAANGAEANVFIYGSVSAISTAAEGSSPANAGGVVGNQSDGYLNYLIAYLTDQGEVKAESPDQGMSRAGGFVGYSKAALNHNVVFLYGSIESKDYLGGTAGLLDNVITWNVWQVTLNRIIDGVGEGAKTVNTLNIKGNGKVKAAIDLFTKRIIFTNVTEKVGTDLNGWYTSASVEVDQNTGNIGEDGNTFLALSKIQNKYVMVVFVNTEIYSYEDLNDMAASVSGGLSGSTIEFTLEDNITIEEGQLTSMIGTAEYPFNNVFNGKGHKITLKNGALPGTDYVALFGYTGTSSKIYNLEIEVEEGTYGSVDSDRTAVLVAYNEGQIGDSAATGEEKYVTVTLDKNAVLRGQTVAIIAASNFGTIEEINLNLYGELYAESDSIARAGGVIGANDGASVSDIKIITDSRFSIEAKGATAYVGTLVGENFKGISKADILYKGTMSVNASMTGYAGGAVGVSLGNLDKIYIEIDGGSFTGSMVSKSGGLVGNNVNVLTSSFVKVDGSAVIAHNSAEQGYADSAVGYMKAKNADKVYNVWVYSDQVANVSRTACINSMIYDPDRPIDCPTAADVMNGEISFTAEITDLTDKVALFAAVDANGSFDVGTGAAMDNVSYYKQDEHSYITYKAYAGSEILHVADVRVRLIERKDIGSGSELYAFALAINNNVNDLTSTTFTLKADFTLPERSFPSIILPEGITFNGEHHVVTVGDATLTNGLFAANNGMIERLGYKLTKAETTAYLVETNNGTIKNSAVYLDRGATQTGDCFAKTNAGTKSTLWLVVRDDNDIIAASDYPTIKIKGEGTLVQGGGDGLTFTANQTEDILFIGYTREIESERKLIKPVAITLDTAEMEKELYTAEFVSKVLDSIDDLYVLNEATRLDYDGVDEVFTFAADLEVEGTLFPFPFRGTIKGNGYTLDAKGTEGILFGKFSGNIESLVIDLNQNGTMTLFGSESTLSLKDVVVLEDRGSFSLGENVVADDVWVMTSNSELYHALYETTPSYSVLYGNGPIGITVEGGVRVATADNDKQVFAGWYADKGVAIDSVTRKNLNITLPTTAANFYYLNYINKTFADEDDLVRLAKAVKNGFSFEGVTFRVKNSEIIVDEKIDTIGDATHEFKGNIYGGSNSKISYKDVEEIAPFLYRVNGEIKSITFRYENVTFDGTPTLVLENAGIMQGIVVIAENGLFAEGAGLTYRNVGEIKNSWLVSIMNENGEGDRAVASGGENANSSLVGVNKIHLDSKTGIEVSFSELAGAQGTRVSFVFQELSKNFLCLYDFSGNVIFPGNYASGTYNAPATASGIKFSAKSIDTINDEDELYYLGEYTTEKKLDSSTVIKLGKDMRIDSVQSSLLFEGLTLDLRGHYLDIRVSAPNSQTIFAVDNKDSGVCSGTVRNGAIYLYNGGYGIGAKGLTLQNVVLFLCDSDITLPEYNLVGNVYVVSEESRVDAKLSGTDYIYRHAPRDAYSFRETPEEDAALYAVFDVSDDYKISLIGQENDIYYFGGYEIADNTYYFAAKEIDSALKLVNFKKAAMLSGYWDDDEASDVNDYLCGTEIDITADFTVNGSDIHGLTFAGTLRGNGYTITIEGGTFNSSCLTIKEGGSFSKLALSFVESTIGETSLISVEENAVANGLVLVVYQSGTSVQTEEFAIVVNVYGEQGEVSVSYEGDSVWFIAKDSGYYAFKEWKVDTESIGRKDYDGEDYKIKATQSIKAYFELRYNITVEYDGVDETILKRKANDLPTFENIGVIFGKGSGDKITVKVDDIGKDFLFKGITSDDVASVNVGENAREYVVELSDHYDVTLKVELRYIEMIWRSVDYKGDDTDLTDYAFLDNLKTELEGASFTVEYSYKALDNTPDLVGDRPYHAGDYLVSFTVKEGGAEVCKASSGLTIRKAKLSFTSVKIKDKIYDATADAEPDGDPVLEGFFGDDGNYITVVGWTFHFADANVGVNKPVYISGEGVLGFKAPTSGSVNDKYKSVYLDYEFDSSSITTSGGEPIRATINYRSLVLTIESKEVEYLDQFDEGKEEEIRLKPVIKEGIVESDKDSFDKIASGLITRERADCYDVGYYRIIVGDSFAFPNYKVEIDSGNVAYYIVKPSEIRIEFVDDDTMVYGDKNHTPKYKVYKHIDGSEDEVEVDLCAYDSETPLLFTNVVYNEGNTLLPGGKYSFTCLFSAENKNYTVKEGEAGRRIVNGKALVILTGSETLTVTPKTVKVTSDASRNAKIFGKRTESLFATLALGESFEEVDAKLVVSRAPGEVVGEYELKYAVMVGEEDITYRYKFQTASGSPYMFEIKQATIVIKPNKTQLVYGTAIEMDKIKTAVSVEGGGISLADLYYATNWTEENAPEKADATLSDLGITLTFVLLSGDGRQISASLPSAGEYDLNIDVNNTNANVLWRVIGDKKSITVQKRYLNATIKDVSKTYDGSSEVNYSRFGVELNAKESGILDVDKKKVKVVANSYTVVGNSASVGNYKIEADLKLSGESADNYYLTYTRGTYTVKAITLDVSVEIGYFDETGNFTPASIKVYGVEMPDRIYYGDSRAAFRYSISDSVSFLEIPDGTDKEVSDYIANTLKIVHYRLNGLLPDLTSEKPQSKYYDADEIGMTSANNNYDVRFDLGFEVQPVYLTVKLVSGTKTIGEPDPEISYKIIAKDATSNEVISNYDEIAKDTFDVVISAERKDGEKLGSYSYQNISVELVNLAVGTTLNDDESFGDSVEIVTKGVSLKIKEKSFLKTTIGKLVVYGLPLVAFATGVVLMIVLIPRARKKRKAKKPDDPNDPSGGDGGVSDDDFDAADFDITPHN